MGTPDGTADPVSHDEIDRIVAGVHHDPHSVLGAHPGPGGVTIRALRPLAASVAAVLPDGRRFAMDHVHQGVFSVTLPVSEIPDYRLAVAYQHATGGGAGAGSPSDAGVAGDDPGGTGTSGTGTSGTGTLLEYVSDDPYRHLPTLGDIDLHLIGEGRHEALWQVLGAHVQEKAGGTSFAVWAPNAQGVRVIGDFNGWDGRAHPMRSLGSSGVWELFVPEVRAGTRYKYEICGPDGTWHSKADPMATRAEEPPATASVVFDSGYEWGDRGWLDGRAARDLRVSPMSVYEVHIGSWRLGLSYVELASQLVSYVAEMGFTHVEFMPVAEHPFGGSWGYQVTSYYAPTARFGTPDDFRYLVDQLHQAGIGVLVDWVPAHFPRDAWALARFDGRPLYENADPQRGEHPDWGTLIFDYGRPEVRNFLVANALFWLEEYHIDGLRVDAVASMLYLDYSRKAGEWSPNALGGRENLDAVSLLQEVNATCYKRVPGVMMIAEESTAWPGVTRPVHLGGLGFGLKWNLGWMHDTLAYLGYDPVYRQYHHNEMTFSMIYAFTENFVLPLSHDEVVHGKGSLLRKMAGDPWRKFAGLRALFAYMWAHPGKQVLFMGSEFGQAAEWSEQTGIDWEALGHQAHAGVQRLVGDLNSAYRAAPALWTQDFTPDGFGWIDANDSSGNVLSFLRFASPGQHPAATPASPGQHPAATPASPGQHPAATPASPGQHPAATPASPGQHPAATPASPGMIACVANFSGEPHYNYRVGLPRAGRWREVINTDAEVYGGSGVGNLGGIDAVAEPWHNQPASAVLTVPPLGVLWLAPEQAP